jgi:hypothetical protein
MGIPDKFRDVAQQVADEPHLDPSIAEEGDEGEEGMTDEELDASVDAEADGEGEGQGEDDDDLGEGERQRDQRRRPADPSVDDLRRDNGRLRAELERLRQQANADSQRTQAETIASLQRQIEELRAQRAAPEAVRQPDRLLSDEEVDLVGGEETAKLIERLADRVAERRFHEASKPFTLRMDAIQNVAAATEEEAFIASVRQAYPNLDALRSDQDWKSFALTNPPGVYGKTYRDIMIEAHSMRQRDGVLAVLQTYEANRQARGLDRSQQRGRQSSGNVQQPQQQASRLRLGDFAQPSKSGVSSPGQSRSRAPNEDDVARWNEQLQRGQITHNVFRKRMAQLNG